MPPRPIAVLVGNPRAASRTRLAAEQLAVDLAAHLPESESTTIDLATIGPAAVGTADPAPTSAVAQAIRDTTGARVLVIATPVYKAAYTGLLKLFLDQLAPGALDGVVAVPVTIAAAPTHAALADLQLRPVLAELGASLPVPALALTEKELPNLTALTRAWAAQHGAAVRALTDVGAGVTA
ncbi:NADPH-dependent FMN reductase [Phytomonospora endophytica]|uniref:FMN reductase n=1 Tax=Phytomonospora endophytica TaxID=714109 RepID=A0A841FLH9_9ACTN|nr:NAD(P)H-dependent oxidoreductase [Phytomonospora endophytica]MBB6037016.1 FMN reductase [Phytomonospora endophytica]GIG69440.1 FMN reductase [Phytomonospora endophytica]